MIAEQIFLEPRVLVEDEPETTVICTPIRYPVPSDPTSEQMMRAVEVSGVLDFWNDPAEDIYSTGDGEPL